MKKIFILLQLFYLIFYIYDKNKVKGDLPIHVEIHHLLGKWEILPTETSTVISNCGSSYPNNNLDNLKIKDYKEYLLQNKFQFTEPIRVILSDDFIKYGDLYDTSENQHRSNWKILAVYNEEGKVIGNWTTIYNEGFEIKIGNNTYTALMHYESNGKCSKITNDDSLDSNGETECYITNYNKIRFGWFDKYSINRSEDTVYGCFYAEKIIDSNKKSETQSFLHDHNKTIKNNNNNVKKNYTNSAFQMLEHILESEDILDIPKSDTNKKHYYEQSDSTHVYPENSELNWHKEKHFGKKKNLNNEILTKNSKQKYACPCSSNENVQNLIHKEEAKSILSNSLIELDNTNEKKENINPNRISTISIDSDISTSNKLDLETYENTTKKNHEELEINDLPKNFTWGDPFNKNEREYDVLNQLKCGSCYIASLLYTLKRRIEIELTKKLGKEYIQNFDDNLSIQSILSCSFYDQGCHGGYPFLVGKYAELQGIPLNSCMPYTAKEEKCIFPIKHSFNQINMSENILKNIRKINNNTLNKDKEFNNNYNNNNNDILNSIFSFIDKETSCNISNRWFIKNYGYIGGCYGCNQCNGEKIMMNEIIKNGPIVASFEASPNIYNYVDGIYYEENYPHAKRCTIKKKKFNEFNITGWERVNHAIVIVGWGENIINKKIYKYWIARNSWGNQWGKQGYFKIKRGVNFNGIESQNVFVDPDLTRGAGKKIIDLLSKKE